MGTKGHVDCPLSLLMKSKTEKCTFCNRGSFDYIRAPFPPLLATIVLGKGKWKKGKA